VKDVTEGGGVFTGPAATDMGCQMNLDAEMKDAIQKVAQAKVAEALGGDVLGKMIEAVMNHRDKNMYNRNAEKTVFEQIVAGLIEDAVRDATREHLKANIEQIKAAVSAGMAAGADKIATAVADAYASEEWRAELKIVIDRPRTDD
jgi:hypothetical protein